MIGGKEAKTLVIDEFHSKQGGFFKLPNGAYSHYSCGNSEVIINTKGKTTVVDIKGIKKYFEEMVRKENEVL